MGKLKETIQGLQLRNEKYTKKAFEHIDYMDSTIKLYEDEDICCIYAIKPLVGGAPNVFIFTDIKVHTFIDKKYYINENEKVSIKASDLPGAITISIPQIIIPRAAFEAYFIKPSPFFAELSSAQSPLVEEIEQIIKQNNSAGGFNISYHVRALAAVLKPDAHVLFAFAGLVVEWHGNTSACAVTDDGYLTLASAGMLTGNDAKRFRFSDIREFSVKNDMISNRVIVQTLTEYLQISVADKNRAFSIYNKLTELKEQFTDKQTQESKTGAGFVADELIKFKSLLDMGAITQEEFDKKKKELLDL